jgi:hypothetical protein
MTMSPASRRRFPYDVFVSYSHRNQDWVRGWLVPQLKHAGLRVCIDHESFALGAPIITEIERAVLQSRKTLLVLTPEYMQSGWTEFENLLVQTSDPASHQRRLILALLRDCELPPRIRALVPMDFTQSEEHTEQIVRLRTAIRGRPAARRRPQAETMSHLAFGAPTGALSPDSPVYIERRYDHDIQQQVTRADSTTIIEGARQMGKSSLVARALAHAHSQQCIVLDFDFQEFDAQCLSNLETLLRYLADAIHERLRLSVSPGTVWQSPLGAKDKLTSFIHDHVLSGARRPVVVVLDEVDRVFGQPYQDDFFALLRAWHNRRARDPLWRRLNLVLAYSTDPRQAITDLNQSPFNVGTKIQLGDFSVDEVWELNRRYGRPLQRKEQLQRLVDVIGGHPYLAQQALYALAARTHTLPSILNTDSADVGPFADHLQHYRYRLISVPELRQALQQAIMNGTCPTYEAFLQLRALGLVTGSDHNAAVPRCRLYAAYFQRVWS